MEQKEIIYILCEGNSETNYITRLNKFLDNEGYNFTFQSENLHGSLLSKTDTEKSAYNKITNKFKNLLSKSKKGLFVIWLDDDVFKRQQLKKDILENLLKNFNSIHKKIKIIYSYENFEDFLSMHLEQELFEQWERICLEQNHFETPMISTVYEPLIRTIIKGYSKEKLPSEIHIDVDTIKILKERQNNKNFHAKCDLINFIVDKLKITC